MDWWAKQGSHFPSVPPESTLQDVLRDLFGALNLPVAFSGHRQNDHSSAPDVGLVPDPWGFSAGMPGCAPAASLASRQYSKLLSALKYDRQVVMTACRV